MLLGEAVKVKPKWQWRTQDTGDARIRMSATESCEQRVKPKREAVCASGVGSKR